MALIAKKTVSKSAATFKNRSLANARKMKAAPTAKKMPKLPSTTKLGAKWKAKTPALAVAAIKPESPASAAYKQSLSLLVKNYIGEIGGPDALKIAECIGEGATDESIEQGSQLKLAEVRSILNHLHSYGVVEYNRDKNMTNGWFTYTWRINHDRAMQNCLQTKRREYAELLRQKTSGDGAQTYLCRKGCVKLGFDEAMENRFRCPACKANLKFADASDSLKKTEQKIRQIEQLMGKQF
jgi:transcription factor E